MSVVAINHIIVVSVVGVVIVDIVIVDIVNATIIRMISSAHSHDTTTGIIGINHVVVAISNNSNARDVIAAIIVTYCHNNNTVVNPDILAPINYQRYLHYHHQHHH